MAMSPKKLTSLMVELANKFELEQCGHTVSIAVSFCDAPKEVIDAMRGLPGTKTRVCLVSPNGKEETHEYDELTCEDLSQAVGVGFSAYSLERMKLAITGTDLTDTCHEFSSAVFAETTDSLNSAEVPDEEAAEKLASIARTFLSKLDGGS